MKNEKQIKVPAIGGSFNIKTEIEIDEYRGQKLGTALTGAEEIFTERVDHIEAADGETMTFDFGTVRKAFIKSLIWHKDNFGAVVAFVKVAAH